MHLEEPAAVGPEFRAGFVAIVGKPNVGKSTLLNSYLGQKVAIVSSKPQTTRAVIRGGLTLPQAQIIFLDTPGIHQPVHKLGEYMVAVASRTVEDADVVLFLVDLSHRPTAEDRQIADLLREKCRLPLIVGLNKSDTAADPQEAGRPYLELLLDESGRPLYQAAVYLSALQGQGRQELLEILIEHLPVAPPYYPADFLTDQPLRVVAAELVREQVLQFTRKEVPHAVAVVVEEFKERSEDMTYIRANLYVERDSQKKILLGSGGRMIKRIGQAARQELEAFLGTQVYLDLWVKVRKNWRKRPGSMRWLGYDLSKRG
ncbi:MAG: GTPase Era [Chloroflexia bacterium]|nr:GTPase Era [Chloroflexia bacterium]